MNGSGTNFDVLKEEQIMRHAAKSLALGLLVGSILFGCQKTATIATGKDTVPTCCGAPMEKTATLAEMKCPACGKTALTSVNQPMKCPVCHKMMKPTGRTTEMFKCTTCGKISITGGSIDTPG
jgi:predicted RNA-binding Zn-ribbon protein involved in translation (DUF1610 family)